MTARQRAASDLAVATGWNGEAFARTKHLKSLAELLDHRTDEQRAADGAAKVLALLQRKFDEQEKPHGAE